ncbi:dienelactone hydrolase family protein [Novosphingobium sp. JCM 18896]|uniref:dienelactone hydrolase family protein n=1 Tax=Novosphingobium sp. JCM 18896 TaxID=2989731 RepID=UPI0022213197|nr:dienelactone hydrolase family protein [Novosphingobium sp. JCM 18896]MCW1431440.1 dienelactone hydrolase family protein [Novosphingobium sp. JCM 18896]
MCDDFTETTAAAALVGKGLSRRDFAAMGAAGAAMLAWNGAAAAEAGLTERMVQVPTPDGTCDAFFVHPAKGAHPGVILWPDIAGLREAKQVMARRLAAEGYAVLVVNQYYRGAKAPVLASFAEWRTPAGQAKITPLREALTAEAVTRDGKAYAAWLDGQPAVDKRRKIGTQGYCMGGPFTVRTAFAAPERVGAAASFHGGGLVGDAADSPAKLLDKTKASYLFAIARNDDARAPGDKDALRVAADAAKRPAEIEVYPADHGWCVPDSPVYDQVQADRAWGRLLALYAKL